MNSIRIQEDIKQDRIERNVAVDITECESSDLLLFVTNPDLRIDSESQQKLALEIFDSHVGGLNNKPAERDAAILSEAKLQDLGFVDFLDFLADLPREFQD